MLNFLLSVNRMAVGQTGDTLYQHMLLNFSKTRTRKMDDPVANPFSQREHDIKHFRICCKCGG